jgi:hypothetical protein
MEERDERDPDLTDKEVLEIITNKLRDLRPDRPLRLIAGQWRPVRVDSSGKVRVLPL